MNTRQLVATLALSFAAAGAFAQEAGSDAWMQAASTQTRAQVQAELAQARADGSIKAFSAGYIPSLKPTASRAEVAAAVQAARANGEFDRIQAEAWAFEPAAPASATRLAQTAR